MRYLLFALFFALPAYGYETVVNQKNVTYSASVAAIAPPATPTDLCTISGNATKKVAVTHVVISSTQTTAGLNTWYLTKRSKADSGGGFSAMTVVPHSTSFPAPASTPASIPSPLPSLGPSIGDIRAVRLVSPAPAGTTPGMTDFVLGDMDLTDQPVILNSAAETLSVNFKGAALPTGLTLDCNFSWTEY